MYNQSFSTEETFSLVNKSTGEVLFTGNLRACCSLQHEKSPKTKDILQILADPDARPTFDEHSESIDWEDEY